MFVFPHSSSPLVFIRFAYNTVPPENSKMANGGPQKTRGVREKKIMSDIVATYVVASQLPERRLTGMRTTRANLV